MKTENFNHLIDDQTEYFDIDKFYENNKEGQNKTNTTENHTTTLYTAGKEGAWFTSLSTGWGSFFSVYKEYSGKGIIRCKWVTFRNRGAAVGMKYYFDAEGRMLKSDDMEKDFLFTPQQAIGFCIEKDIDLLKENDHFIERYNDHSDKKSFYVISYKGTYNEQSGRIFIILDGNTGLQERVVIHPPGKPGKVIYKKDKLLNK
ncbi:hypothetical protein [Chryseobacterium hagamense]|uniref:Uncharacterized protein n=1 Tax=Chryseobacterium hagamense TaxID=395935 RepID=A0A511YSB8_9FLAO|nr:hypothetical protein [Chryseobacterium hagamense]GEN78093.1 hypothetical protein CHA01nite_38330 [Chryseobacterium hagamense]